MGPDIGVTVQLMPHLAFGGDIWPQHMHVSVSPSLENMAARVESIRDQFTRFFPAGPAAVGRESRGTDGVEGSGVGSEESLYFIESHPQFGHF